MYGYCGCLCNFFPFLQQDESRLLVRHSPLAHDLYKHITNNILLVAKQKKSKGEEKSHTPKLTLGRVAFYYAIAP